MLLRSFSCRVNYTTYTTLHAGPYHSTEMEIVEEFKYSRNILKHQNYFHIKIKIRVKTEMLATVRCRLLSCSLVSKNLKTEINRNIILLFCK